MSWFLETRSLLGDWQPQLWADKPRLKDNMLLRADSAPVPARSLKRIPQTEVRLGLTELHRRYGARPVFRTTRRK